MIIKSVLADAKTAFSQDNIIADYRHGVNGKFAKRCQRPPHFVPKDYAGQATGRKLKIKWLGHAIGKEILRNFQFCGKYLSMSEQPTTQSAVKLTSIQRLIGRRMLNSKRTKACFYLELKADVTEMVALRPKLKKALDFRVTTSAFYVRALALAVKRYPLMLGRFAGDNIEIRDSINVGFAVSAPQGLVVPVIKQADEKKLIEIARLEKTLSEKALSNKLTLEDLDGQTIALSNLGPYGIDSFLAIVPPTTSTILAVGNVVSEAVPIDGKPAARKMVSLSLAVDHRIVNGEYAACFLSFIKELLQNPGRLT
jgi:pyruvate dehydrogenase E2 component (dihydrolipoamide acetyltransferase)